MKWHPKDSETHRQRGRCSVCYRESLFGRTCPRRFLCARKRSRPKLIRRGGSICRDVGTRGVRPPSYHASRDHTLHLAIERLTTTDRDRSTNYYIRMCEGRKSLYISHLSQPGLLDHRSNNRSKPGPEPAPVQAQQPHVAPTPFPQPAPIDLGAPSPP